MPRSDMKDQHLVANLVRVLAGIGIGLLVGTAVQLTLGRWDPVMSAGTLLAAPVVFATVLELYSGGPRRRRIARLAGGMVGWFVFYSVLVMPGTHQWLWAFGWSLPGTGTEFIFFGLVAVACVAGGLFVGDRTWSRLEGEDGPFPPGLK